MMPPNVHHSEPAEGEILAQNLLILCGNTLSQLTAEDLSVRTTGWFSRAIEFELEGDHKIVGESDDPDPIPGTFQEESLLRIRLLNPPKHKKLRISVSLHGHEIWAGNFRTAR